MKKRLMSLLAAFTFIFIASCDDDHGGNVEAYDTVYAYATYDADLYESDAVVWKDLDGDTFCDAVNFFEDDISITVISNIKPYLPDNFTASELKITGYTVNFTPHEDSPAVPSKQISHDLVLEPGASFDIPIRIIDQGDKSDSTHPLYYLNTYAVSDSTFEYTITITIKAVEVLTGVKHFIKAKFPLHYLDLIGDDDDCT